MEQRQDLEVQAISRPRAEYFSAEYTASGLPKAPAITIDGRVVVAGRDIEEAALLEALAK